ncbi:biotin--protein ligase [Rhodanobacter sp. PCA2]|uniref:biotin--protein ligase n=1 Tax=Rhodanobacter sp. PCA2 TaxID=2006117 RepID=UPI0015E7E4DF|nr:biotin--protein ligase [Rhodanobacter sp. PCA2]MBA2079121.1 biotin--protein ligase [Rhodanobacter sp. PCA2]
MHGEYKMPGGKLVVMDLALRDGRLADVRLSGDFFLEPDTALPAIDAALEGRPVASDDATLAAAVEAALPAGTMMYGISVEAILVALRRALHEGAHA